MKIDPASEVKALKYVSSGKSKISIEPAAKGMHFLGVPSGATELDCASEAVIPYPTYAILFPICTNLNEQCPSLDPDLENGFVPVGATAAAASKTVLLIGVNALLFDPNYFPLLANDLFRLCKLL